MKDFYEMQQYKRFAVTHFGKLLSTPEEQVSVLFPWDKLNHRLQTLTKIQAEHLPSLLPMLYWNVGATPLSLHSYNVGSIAVLIGKAAGLNEQELLDLATAALFHDIGEKYIGRKILEKTDYLSATEFFIIKQHPIISVNFLKTYYPQISENVWEIILKHHEKLDGSGYYGFKAEDIDKYTRILTVANTFCAATEERVYHPARPLQEGLVLIQNIPGLDQTYCNILANYLEQTSLPELHMIY